MAVLLGAVGVPHYTKDGKLFTGPTHKDASGRLMTGRTHTANSQFLFHSKSGIGATKSKRIKLDKLEAGDVFQKPKSEVKYLYYGRQKNFDRFGQLKSFGPHFFAVLGNMREEYFTNEDISVILVEKVKSTPLKKNKK